MKYDIESNVLNKKNTPYFHIKNNVGNNQKILDVGCATGYVGDLLSSNFQNIELIGIDNSKKSLNKAKEKNIYLKLILMDLNDFSTELDDYINYFDIIIITDVLEHLIDPMLTLKRLSKYLKKEGKILVDVPNIAHGSIKYNLLINNFNYNPVGLLDETHLRFFTPSSFIKKLSENSFWIENIEYIFKNPTFDTYQSVDLLKYTEHVIQFIEQDIISYIFQIFVVISNSDFNKTEVEKHNFNIGYSSEKLNKNVNDFISNFPNESMILIEDLTNKLKDDIYKKHSRILELNEIIVRKEENIKSKQSIIDSLNSHINENRYKLNENKNKLNKNKSKLKKQHDKIQKQREIIHSYQNSNSWKITKPLRIIYNWIKK